MITLNLQVLRLLKFLRRQQEIKHTMQNGQQSNIPLHLIQMVEHLQKHLFQVTYMEQPQHYQCRQRMAISLKVGMIMLNLQVQLSLKFRIEQQEIKFSMLSGVKKVLQKTLRFWTHSKIRQMSQNLLMNKAIQQLQSWQKKMLQCLN